MRHSFSRSTPGASATGRLGLACLALFAVTTLVCAADFHLSPSGDDDNDGRTPATAWRTLVKASQFAFQPGDRLLLEGGARFEGTLKLGERDGGDPDNPVVITSYGDERAILDGGDSHAIHVVNTRGLVVRNLRLVGSGRNSSQRGVGILLDPGYDAHLGGIEASGFQIAGIMVTGGSENVRVTRCYVHDNGYTGIGTGYFYGRSSINRNIYIGHNRAIANPGISDETAGFRDQSGSGINLYRVEGGLVEFNESARNGADFFHRAANGPVGIWTAWCRNVTIQFNISHSNQAWYVAGNHKRGDGGGIDLDSGSKDCIVQYNYTYDNAAAGFMLCAYTNEERHRLEGNIVRYNISENDGRQDHRAGFVIHAPEAQSNSHVYNNVIFNSGGRDVVMCFAGHGTPEFFFRNNIFVLQGDGRFVRGGGDLVFQNNLYWHLDGGGDWDGHSSLEAWREATGKEMLNGQPVGMNVDPLLTRVGQGEKLTDPTKLPELFAYLLQPGSPCVDAGLDLREFGLDPGLRDFYGNPIPQGAGFDIGAHEFAPDRMVADPKPRLRALIIDGQNNHNWRATTPILKRILEESGRFTVEVATSPAGPPPRPGDPGPNATAQHRADYGRWLAEWRERQVEYEREILPQWETWRPRFGDFDVLICNYNGDLWPVEVREAFVEYVRGGGGVVIVHAANNAFANWPEYNEIIGLGGWEGRNERWGPYVRWRDGEIVYDTTPGIGGSHGSQHEFVVETRAPDHPIMRGLPPRWMHAQDELYAELRGPARNLTVLATAYSAPETGGTGEHEPMLITVRYGKGRTFQTMMGDGSPGMACVGFWVTLQRGAEWAATGTVTLTDVPDDFPTETRSRSRK
jgi:uncharacterized protein